MKYLYHHLPRSEQKGVNRNLGIILSDNLEVRVARLLPVVVESLEAGGQGGGGEICRRHFDLYFVGQ